jgi:dihydropteroate synthase
MGILNVTPDSFSDGANFLQASAAVAHGLALAAEGAQIVDVGGESTRPGSQPVSTDEELRRVLPVVEALAAAFHAQDEGLASSAAQPPAPGAPNGLAASGVKGLAGGRIRTCISIDTSKSTVARAALKAGARLVNDVTAFRRDRDMAAAVAESDAECCLMHMRGEPRTMQQEPRYDDVVDDVKAFLEARLHFAVREGVREERVLLDPGIGFGKTHRHNLELLSRLQELTELGRPIVIGTSRKAFLGRLAGDAAGLGGPLGVEQRLAGTVASNVLALERGARVFRVHDVAPVRDALAVAVATLAAHE